MRFIAVKYFLLLSLVALLLVACGPATVGQLTKQTDARQLSAEEILTLTQGNTLYIHGHKVESYLFFDDSGNAFARDIFSNHDTGRWDVSEDGELCLRMKKWWFGQLRCFPVYQDTAKYYLFNSSGVLQFTAEQFQGDSKKLFFTINKSKRKFLIAQRRKKSTASLPAATDAESGTGESVVEPPTIGQPSAEEITSTVKWMARDCPDCNLAHTNLTGADLVGAKLQGANLSGTNLRKANLRRADLKGANLADADLSYANLPGADLRDSDLSNAILKGANLIRSNLTGAKTDGANFEGALLEGAEGYKQ